MAIEIGTVNADTSVKLGTTTIQSGYIGYNNFYGTEFKILDLFPSAHHAFSLRKLRTAYTGFCLRIRRTTTTPTVTTTTVDLSFDTATDIISLNSAITFVSGTATTAINLGQFCASVVNGYTNPDGVNTNQNIFVVTWFDQSGNVKNPTQATAGLQPRLVNLGNLEVSGGKVAVRFVKASSTRLNINDTTANINNMSSYYVGAFASTTSGQIGYSLASTPSAFYFPYLATSNIFAGYEGSTTAIQLEAGTTTDRRLYELLAPSPLNSAVVQGWTNGVAKLTYPLTSATIARVQLGGTGVTNLLDGYIQEVIGWQTNINRPEKEININSYWQIF
jgi:hypothetical protein